MVIDVSEIVEKKTSELTGKAACKNNQNSNCFDPFHHYLGFCFCAGAAAKGQGKKIIRTAFQPLYLVKIIGNGAFAGYCFNIPAGSHFFMEVGTERVSSVKTSIPRGNSSCTTFNRFGSAVTTAPAKSWFRSVSSTPQLCMGNVNEAVISAAIILRSSWSGSINRKWSGGCKSSHCRSRARTSANGKPACFAEHSSVPSNWSTVCSRVSFLGFFASAKTPLPRRNSIQRSV